MGTLDKRDLNWLRTREELRRLFYDENLPWWLALLIGNGLLFVAVIDMIIRRAR